MTAGTRRVLGFSGKLRAWRITLAPMTEKTRQARMVSAVVQKLRIVQSFGRLILRLLAGLNRRRGRRAELKNVTERYDNNNGDQGELKFFHSVCVDTR